QVTTTASTTGFGGGTSYNFHWTGSPGGAVGVTDFTGVSPFVDKSIPLGGLTDKLGPGTYTMRVTNMSNNCFTDGNVTLEQNTIPVNVAAATSSPLTNCTVLDGSVTVTGMTVGGSAAALADFTYNWKDNLGGPVGVGATVNNLTFGDYLVTATKSVATTPSSGCSSAPFKVTIQDNRAYPTVTMTPVSSTSCDTNYDGQITVSASTPGFGGATNYNFHWTSNPGGTVIVTDFTGVSPFVDKSLALGGATDKLGPGGYTMRVTNQSNNCFTDAGASLQQNTIPIDVATATSSPLTNCAVLNGSVTVLSMTVGGSAAALTDFTYNWKDNLGGAAGVGTTVNNLNFGDYFVTATKSVVAPITASAPGSGCSSSPFKVTIQDNRAYPVVTMTPVSSTSCDTNYDGQITVSASTTGFGGATNYNFHWTANPGGSVIVTDFTGVSPFIDQSQALGGATDKLGPGAYTMRVTNQSNNCFADAGASIQQNTVPITVATAGSLPLTHCTVPDGQVSVTTVNVGGVAEPMGNLTFAWTGNGGPYNTSTVNGLTAGDYIVTVQKSVAAPLSATTPASGCSSAPFTVTVKDTRQYPVVSMSTIANTSCDLNYNGSITVTANTSGMPGANYNFIWTSDPDGLVLNQYQVTDGLATTSPYTTLATDKVGSSATPYVVQVTNLTNMCKATASTTVQQNTLPVQVVTASAINQTKCVAPFDGQVTVSGVNVGGVAEPIGNLTFLWTGPGGPYNTQTVPALAAGDYILTATKNVAGPASGCASSPFTVTVLDTHVTPVISFATIANSACDINYDGSITVTATTSGFPAGGTFYDFDWTSVPGLSTAADALNVLSPYTTTAGDKIGAGAYNITVTNKTSGCFATGSVTMVDNPQTLDVLAVTTTDQLTCNPGGSIAVTSLSSGAVGNYSYSWYRNDPTTGALLDGIGNPITVSNLVAGGAATQYPTMGSGSFFVTAKKNPGVTPGSGCVTPAFRVDIKDLHVDPQVQFAFTSNSSCDVTNPNGTLLATASEKSGPTGDTYSFAWTYNGGTLPPVTISTSPSISSNQLTKVFEGAYVVTAKNTTGTGCSVTASVAVDLNQDISKPNIIDVNTVDPVTCLPAGSATVASVSIGGGPAITGPALATNFTYEWYKDDFIPSDIIVGQTLPSLNNISPASYFVTVKDNATQCQSVARQVDINKTAIVYPQVGITQTAKQISCIAANGTAALLSLADGQNDTNANYQFTWYNTLDFTGPVFANTSTISNLKTGNYSLNVLNVATGCTGTALFIVPDESPLFTPVPSVQGNPRTFCVGLDGDVLIRVVNIDPNYPFPYNFKADLYFSANANPSAPPDIANLPFEAGFTTNFIQTGLDIGFYTGKITDNNTGCFALATTEIKDQRTKPVIVVVEDAPMTNCDPGIANGQLSATADNGKIQGYSFQWYPGSSITGVPVSSINKLIGQTAGPYIVRVTNAITGCFDDKGGTITDKTVKPFAPTATVLQDRTSCVSPNGWVTADVGGSLLYYFKWYNGSAVKSSADHSDYFYNNVDVGSYTVTATDPNTGCVSPPATVDVKDKRVTPQFVLSSTPSYCTDSGRDPVGTITLQVTSTDTQIEDIVYTLAGTTQVAGHGAEVNGLWPGFYEADVTSVEGCKNSDQIEVKTEISPFNGISLNGDGKNDFFIVDCISLFPNNNVKIFNRSGVKVFEANGYNNVDNVFRGLGENGLYTLGNELPDGTYYYIIDKRDGSKPVAGFLELLR
ncbi:MAG: gliding motility-associated C-terminal domain-containing protein, partial [Bacteroidetes bacterium]|nr:gliding motility-associated C-terminal domain-containing protein [Bacteroidota bacterium]